MRAVAGVADSEDDATMEEVGMITSSVGVHPAPDNNDNTQQLVHLEDKRDCPT